jgi:uncharacterized protein YqfA (UPF0365 family)
MRDSYLLFPVLSVIAALALRFLPLRAWLYVRRNDLKIGLGTLAGMGFRRSDAMAVVEALVMARNAGITQDVLSLEALSLAGGSPVNVVRMLVAAREAGRELSFHQATAIELARTGDLVEGPPDG